MLTSFFQRVNVYDGDNYKILEADTHPDAVDIINSVNEEFIARIRNRRWGQHSLANSKAIFQARKRLAARYVTRCVEIFTAEYEITGEVDIVATTTVTNESKSRIEKEGDDVNWNSVSTNPSDAVATGPESATNSPTQTSATFVKTTPENTTDGSTSTTESRRKGNSGEGVAASDTLEKEMIFYEKISTIAEACERICEPAFLGVITDV